MIGPTADVVKLQIPRRAVWGLVDNAMSTADCRAYSQPTLALVYPVGSGVDSVPGARRRRRRLKVADGIPDPEAWASRFLQAVLEVLSGDRPVGQLARWADADVFADIERRALHLKQSSASTRVGRANVVTIHTCLPTPTSAEVAARVSAGNRSKAIAARLEYRQGRWLCTALDFG